MEIQSGLINNLSHLIGTSEPALRLLLSLFAGYPLAFVHRSYFSNKNSNIQHLYFILTGCCLGYWNYGINIIHPLFTILFTYFILKISTGTKLSVGIIFFFNLCYLLAGYYYVGTDDYDINWTLPQCVLVLRLIGITFDLYDGKKPIENLSNENKKVALENCPTIFEFLGHMLFPASFMIGPQFPMKRYQNFIKNNWGIKYSNDSLKASMNRLFFGLFYLILFQIFGLIINDNYLLNDKFNELNIIKKLLLIGLWGRYTLYKYISCWLITEGACILFGVSFNDFNENNKIQWNGLENIKLSIFENTTEFNHYIQSFNVNTNHWIAQYIYKRLKFLNNRHISQIAALLFLSIWHGFHSGYYVCFFFEFIVIYVERDFKSIINSNEYLINLFNNFYISLLMKIILRFYTFIFMGWCLMPFVLLKFHKYWKAFGSVYYCGILLFIFYPIFYGPLLKFILNKKKRLNITTSKEKEN